MLNQPMIEKLLAMRLHGMVESLESTGTRSRGERVEFPGTVRAAGRSAMELAGESGPGAATAFRQAEGSLRRRD